MEPTKEFNLKAIFSEIVDVDRLVELVRVRPVIWDNTVEGYRNRDVSTPAWQEIYRIMFDNYDALHVEQKTFIGKVIKDKWTNARDIWQRSHKKRKEAMQKGENVNDFKDNARYEKLKFLAKIYDKDDNLQPAKEDNVFDPSLGKIACQVFPKVNLGGKIVPNFSNTDFQGKQSISMNHRTPQKLGFNLSKKKRKLDNSNVLSPLVKKCKDKIPHNPSNSSKVAVNIGDMLKAGFSSSSGKHRISSVDSREIDKSTFNQIQSVIKCEQINPKTCKEEIPANTQSMEKTSDPQKLAVQSPSQFLPQEFHRRPSISSDKIIKPELIEKAGNETEMEQTSSTRISQDNKSTNSEVDQFFQVLRPRIEDFNKTQMIGFLFEILKPRIKDFDKNQLLDFQIETLQLIKKIGGN